jgi:hypothetical protein
MKLLFSIMFIIISFVGTSQNVNNSSFEHWLIGGFVQRPLGWSTSNEFTATQGTYSVSSDTLRHDSFLSAKIVSVPVGFSGQPYAGFVVNGFMLADGNNDFGKIIDAGEPFPHRPLSLKGYYRYESSSPIEDWAHAYVILKHYDSATGTRDTIGIGSVKILGPSTTFKEFTVPINYLIKGLEPDSIVVAFYSSDPISPNLGGKLWVDKISFDYITDLPEPLEKDIAEIVPNPVTDFFSILNFEVKNLRITDVTGRTVLESDQGEDVDISHLPAGTYQLYVESSTDWSVQKLIKN